jgi:hypothetical protein
LWLAWLYVQCQINHHTKSAPRGPIAAPWRGAHRLPNLFLAMVIVMKVVGIDKMKLFRKFIFQKSTVIFTGYQHLRWLFFSDFDMSKKSKITKSALCPLLRWTVYPASSRLLVSEVKYSRRKYRGFNSGPTAVYAPSCCSI